MASLYVKQNKLWARYKDETGKWANMPTPYRPGDEVKARRFLTRVEATAKARREVAESGQMPADGRITLTMYAKKWLADRRKLGLATLCDEETHLKLHILPRLGSMPILEIRPRHISELVLQLRAANRLAPRTIHHVFHTTRAMFRDAVADEVIEVSPCVLRKGILPKKTDKDPSWRHTAIYTREEIERMISDARVPQDRRVLYGLKGLAGLRHGEAATLTWRQYDDTLEPLGGLLLENTKTKVPRRVPVHATLGRMLADWKTTGWEATYGRAPTAEDFVVPTRNFTARPSPDAQRALHLDLKTLGFRLRRGHDLRRTFITLAQVDGARRDLLESVTHGPRGDIVSVYTTFPCPGLCVEIEKLKIELREPLVLDGDAREFATTFATTRRVARNRWGKRATPAGFEPAFSP